MNDLLCPCGHFVSEHRKSYYHKADTVTGWCGCNLDETQALRAAQRRAAIAQLKELARYYGIWRGDGGYDWQMRNAHMNGIKLVYEAYCAVGILGRKVKHDPA